MSQEEDDGAPIQGLDFNELTSLGLSFFDVRNWYKWCNDLRRVGEGVVYQSLTTWDLFVDTEQADEHQGAGDESGAPIRSCPLCHKSTDQPLALRRAEYEGSPSFVADDDSGHRARGGWIFVPDIEEFIGRGALPDIAATESENVNIPPVPLTTPAPEPLTPSASVPEAPPEQVHSKEPGQTAAKAATKSSVKRPKTRAKSRAAKKSIPTKTTRKVQPKKRSNFGYDVPLLCKRPKRPRKGD